MPNSLAYQVPVTEQTFVHAWASTDCFVQSAKNDLSRTERGKIKPAVRISTPIQTIEM